MFVVTAACAARQCRENRCYRYYRCYKTQTHPSQSVSYHRCLLRSAYAKWYIVMERKILASRVCTRTGGRQLNVTKTYTFTSPTFYSALRCWSQGCWGW